MSSLTLLILAIILSVACHASADLREGFYSATCPDAEPIVRAAVLEAMKSDKSAAPKLLRLQFHDCFVRGCDGSILIDHDTAEKHAFANQGVDGFQTIADAKARLEKKCPGVVSCADIVALAARDAIALSKGPDYPVPTGRRDGLVSNAHEAENLPDVRESIGELKAKFAAKGLSEGDMVLLTSAHTIGTTACFFIYPRLYGEGGPDKDINPELLKQLLGICPKGGSNGVRVPLDVRSPDVFDNKLFSNIQTGFGVINSDAAIYQDPNMRHMVDVYAKQAELFALDFANAMVRMGLIGVLTGSQGEIRRVCSSIN